MKSEYEKMMNQEWYDANYDEDIIQQRMQAQDLCFDYNNTRPSDSKKKEALLEKIFGGNLDQVEIVAPVWVDYGVNTTFGKHCYINKNAYFMDGAPITFDDYVFVGPDCGFYTADHGEDIDKRNAGLERALPITIESNVWIGANVTVIQGVTIGEGSVIGAGSVVTKDIPPYSVAVGNPCRVVRPIKTGEE